MSLSAEPATTVVFLDTNVFVHAFLATEARKRETAINLIEANLCSGQGCVSYQVIQEFASVARKKIRGAYDRRRLQGVHRRCSAANEPCRQQHRPDSRRARSKDELRYSFYDSLAIAAALQAGGHTLYSEDLQHWQLVRGLLRIVNPFQEATHEI